ncbi:MAG: DNA polymerase III subunit chi [Gammaproteobacteria bacterium]|nr:DNA polymerase III subunit chi [Gammaproteobacteria bacterium]
MTRVDFYILQDVELTAMQRFACRLACKAVDSGSQVYIHTTNEHLAEDFDELLWAYPEQRFMPHGQHNKEAASGAPVVIGWEEPEGHDDVLINLSDHVPTFFGRFERVAEIVVGETTNRGRERYQFYRDRGYPLFDHHLDDWEAS